MIQIAKVLNLNQATGIHVKESNNFNFLDSNLGIFMISLRDSINIFTSNKYYKYLKEITKTLDIEDIFEVSFITLLESLLAKDNHLLSGPFLIFTPKEGTIISMENEYIIEKTFNDNKKLLQYTSYKNAINVNIAKDFYLYLLKKENKVVAVCSANREVWPIYSIGIEVDHYYRNKGLGSYVLKHVANDLISNELIPIYLTKIYNINSINLANKANFKAIATTIFTI